MRTLYVTVNGAQISKEVLRFIVRSGSRVIQETPVHNLDQIVIVGKAEITHDAIVLAFRHQIDILFLSQRGEIKAELFPPSDKMIGLRLAQYSSTTDDRLKIARQVVMAKLNNCRAILQRQARDGVMGLDGPIEKMQKSLSLAENAESTDVLMGHEGSGAVSYYEGFSKLLRQDFGFSGRNRRPPKDPVNAMLSFGYALLYRLVSRFVRQYGLDAHLGCLHSPKDRRLSLALDLMEEFRPILVDRAVLKLVNRLQVHQEDFRLVPNGGVHMSNRAIGRLVQEYEDRLNQRVFYERQAKHLNWKYVVMQQVALYRRVVLKEEEQYTGVRLR